jgi:hypothetical protein
MGRAKILAATAEEEVLGSDSRPFVGMLQRELPNRLAEYGAPREAHIDRRLKQGSFKS